MKSKTTIITFPKSQCGGIIFHASLNNRDIRITVNSVCYHLISLSQGLEYIETANKIM